jgi:hypothetical protein
MALLALAGDPAQELPGLLNQPEDVVALRHAAHPAIEPLRWQILLKWMHYG